MARFKSNPWTKMTPAQIAELKQLASTKSLFRREIAQKMGLKLSTVSHMMRRLGIRYQVKERYGQWNVKHKHLREAVMTYFLTHSMEETRKHFGLTQSEAKSIFTVGYRLPEFKHLRKETRPHAPWTTNDWVFMVRHVGIRPRQWIAKKLKRGDTYNSVKDALAKFRGYGKYMNGMPVGWAATVFGEDAVEQFSIKTSVDGAVSTVDPWHAVRPWDQSPNPGRTEEKVVYVKPGSGTERLHKNARDLRLAKRRQASRKPHGRSDQGEGDARHGQRGLQLRGPDRGHLAHPPGGGAAEGEATMTEPGDVLERGATVVPINHEKGRGPGICLREVAAEFPEMKGVAVLIWDSDERVHLRWSNLTIVQLIFMERVFKEELSRHLQNERDSHQGRRT